MAVATNKKGCGQPDHQTRKYKRKNRKGVPINSWITTTVTNGMFTREWTSSETP